MYLDTLLILRILFNLFITLKKLTYSFWINNLLLILNKFKLYLYKELRLINLWIILCLVELFIIRNIDTQSIIKLILKLSWISWNLCIEMLLCNMLNLSIVEMLLSKVIRLLIEFLIILMLEFKFLLLMKYLFIKMFLFLSWFRKWKMISWLILELLMLELSKVVVVKVSRNVRNVGMLDCKEVLLEEEKDWLWMNCMLDNLVIGNFKVEFF